MDMTQIARFMTLFGYATTMRFGSPLLPQAFFSAYQIPEAAHAFEICLAGQRGQTRFGLPHETTGRS